jgi:hypothetical protein
MPRHEDGLGLDFVGKVVEATDLVEVKEPHGTTSAFIRTVEAVS